MKRLTALLALCGVAALAPGGAGAATFKGVVVGKLHGSVLVASPAGLVQAMRGKATIGSRIALSGDRLVVVGHSRTAHIRGIVFRQVGTTTFISSGGHLVAVHTGRRLADTTPAPTTPAPGTVVSTQVGIAANGDLDEQAEDDLGQSNASTVPIQAVVSAVGAGTVTLTVNGQSLTVALPAGLTLPSSVVGQTVTLNLSLSQNDEQGDDDSGGDHGGNGDGHGGDDGGGGDGN